MHKRVKTAVAGFGVLAAAAAAVVALPGAADAASYGSECGAGYSVIDQMTVPNYGTVYLTYNSSNGYNCVVTDRDDPGTKLLMMAEIDLTSDVNSGGGNGQEDEGDYSTFAGPVYMYAPGECIDWGGSIDSVVEYQHDSHCG